MAMMIADEGLFKKTEGKNKRNQKKLKIDQIAHFGALNKSEFQSLLVWWVDLSDPDPIF